MPRPKPGPIADAAARPLRWAIVLLAFASLSASARGQHCGSYVTRPGDVALAESLGLSAELLRDLADEPSPSEPVPGLPCRGPSCSKSPAAPSPSPAPTEPPPVEQWALAAPARLADGPGRTPLPSSEPPLPTGRPIGGVFHPPRPA